MLNLWGSDYQFSAQLSPEQAKWLIDKLTDKDSPTTNSKANRFSDSDKPQPEKKLDLSPVTPNPPSDISISTKANPSGDVFAQYRATRTPDKVTVLLYLRKDQHPPTATKEDLIKGLEKYHQPVPKNFMRDIRWAQKIGWVAEVHDEPGNFFITRKGIEIVESYFPREKIEETKHAKAIS